MARARLTRKRLLGLDRSGGAPAETRKGAPLHPWTIPNAIGFLRIALVPVYRMGGDRTMPVWGDAFSRTREALSDADVRQRLDAIVRYLEAIQQRPAE